MYCKLYSPIFFPLWFVSLINLQEAQKRKRWKKWRFPFKKRCNYKRRKNRRRGIKLQFWYVCSNLLTLLAVLALGPRYWGDGRGERISPFQNILGGPEILAQRKLISLSCNIKRVNFSQAGLPNRHGKFLHTILKLAGILGKVQELHSPTT